MKNSSGVAEKTIQCPKCLSKLRVKFNNQADITQYGSVPPMPSSRPAAPRQDDEEFGTNIMSGLADSTIGALLFRSQTFPLELGVNTVGRKAATSPAAIQIPTDNRSMSRLHAIIEISRMFDGSVRAVIKNADNKNPTFVGGQRLIEGDRIVLNDGDVIKMGDVTITYVKD